MTRFGTIILILFLVIIAGAGYLIYISANKGVEQSITSFEECIKAGYPAMESYPRQCRVPGGELFVEVITTPEPAEGAPIVKGGCYVGGCSAQICSDQKDVASTCEFRPEYSCYKTATCERQANGQCGWTQTAELKACLQNPPSL
jgi:hypothetical protein